MDGLDARGHPAVQLQGLDHLNDGAVLTHVRRPGARIGVSETTPSRSSVGGATGLPPPRPPSTPRVDLGLRAQAVQYPCSIATSAPKPCSSSLSRPAPWLHPADALDWLLSTLHPRSVRRSRSPTPPAAMGLRSRAVPLVSLRKSATSSPRDLRHFTPTTREEMRRAAGTAARHPHHPGAAYVEITLRSAAPSSAASSSAVASASG